VSTGAAELLQDTGGVIADEAVETPREIAARSPLELFWRRLRRDKVALLALGFIVGLIVIAILSAPIVKLFGGHPPNAQNSGALDEFGSAAPPGTAICWARMPSAVTSSAAPSTAPASRWRSPASRRP
jgi:peptide/nickel transport system permease protein